MPLICPNPQDQYSESCLSRILQRMEGIYQHNWLEIVCICPSTWNQGSQISGSPPTRLLSVYSWGGWPQYNVMKSLLIFCHVTSEQLLKVTRAYAEWAIKNYHVPLWLYLPSFQWWKPATTLPFCLVGKTLVINNYWQSISFSYVLRILKGLAFNNDGGYLRLPVSLHFGWLSWGSKSRHSLWKVLYFM